MDLGGSLRRYWRRQPQPVTRRECRRFFWLSRTALGKSVVVSQKAGGAVLIVLPVADGVMGYIEIPCERIDLAVGQIKSIGELEPVIGRGHLFTASESDLYGVADVGVLSVLETCSSGQAILEHGNQFRAPSFPVWGALFWLGTGTTTRSAFVNCSRT